MKIIIGITGSFGAGKGEIVNHLVNQKGFSHYSARGFITEEIVRRGLPVNRDSMIIVGNDLRAKFGPTHVIESLFNRAREEGGRVVIESMRAVAEARFIREQGGLVWGVDAHPEIRYERAFKRGSETDNITFEKWLEQEKLESNPDDPTKQHIFGALQESHTIFLNNGTREELVAQIEEALSRHLK